MRAASLLGHLHHRFTIAGTDPFIVRLATSNGSQAPPAGVDVIFFVLVLAFALVLTPFLLAALFLLAVFLLAVFLLAVFLLAAFLSAIFLLAAFTGFVFLPAASASTAFSCRLPRCLPASNFGFFLDATATTSLPTSYLQNINFTPLIPSPGTQTLFSVLSTT